MAWILGWAPIIINIILLPSDPIWILTLPVSAIIGCINVAVYYSKQKNHYDYIILFTPFWLLLGGIPYAIYCDQRHF